MSKADHCLLYSHRPSAGVVLSALVFFLAALVVVGACSHNPRRLVLENHFIQQRLDNRFLDYGHMTSVVGQEP